MVPEEVDGPPYLDPGPLIAGGYKHLFRNFQDLDGNRLSADASKVLNCMQKFDMLKNVFPEMMDTELAFYLELAGSSVTDAVTYVMKDKNMQYPTIFVPDPYDTCDVDKFPGVPVASTAPVHFRIKLFADIKQSMKKKLAQEKLQETDSKQSKKKKLAQQKLQETDSKQSKKKKLAQQKLQETDSKQSKKKKLAQQKLQETDSKQSKKKKMAQQKLQETDSKQSKKKKLAQQKLQETDSATQMDSE